MSLLFQLFISFSSRIPRSYGHSCSLMRRALTCSSRAISKHALATESRSWYAPRSTSGVPRGVLREYILARYWRVAWMLRRPMQRARASRVTVTNENMHSLSYRGRVGRVSLCLFFPFNPFPFSPFAAYRNRCRPYTRREIDDTATMSRRRDFAMRCQYNCACCNAFPTSRTSVTLITDGYVKLLWMRKTWIRRLWILRVRGFWIFRVFYDFFF